MQAIVRIALERPYTFIVMALAIMIGGISAIIRLPVYIFPNVNIPVVAVAFNYTGLSPEDMANRIVGGFERSLTTVVNDVERVESNSMPGMGIIKVYLQPGANATLAAAQLTAFAQSSTRQQPPGATPPFVLNYNASTVPVVQFVVTGEGMTEQQLGDIAQNTIRPRMTPVPGAALPFSFGGKQRQIVIDVDPQALHAKNLSATDINTALGAQTQINPAGNVKIGGYQYALRLNNAPGPIDELNALPIKTTGNETIFMRDVANVRDGNPPQVNVVHVDGQRSVLVNVLKTGATSTLAVVQGVKDVVPELLKILPPGMSVKPVNDQSVFVEAAVTGVIVEGAIAAALTSLLILLFLGSWRSTVIIALSLPLAIMGAIALLALFGETLNIMTLGGIALAVGILVDDATVTIENINWHLEHGKDVRTSILDGAQQIVAPAFVSTLSICIAFVPMFFLPGLAGFLFQPMALSVIFAMVTSFVLSRTLVPTLAMYLLKQHALGGHAAELDARRTALTLNTQRLQAAVDLIRAMGGGWVEQRNVAQNTP